MSKSPMRIKVTSNGKTIGHLSTKEFKDYMNRPNRFLAALVEDFNKMKAELGEPERAEITIS